MLFVLHWSREIVWHQPKKKTQTEPKQRPTHSYTSSNINNDSKCVILVESLPESLCLHCAAKLVQHKEVEQSREQGQQAVKLFCRQVWYRYKPTTPHTAARIGRKRQTDKQLTSTYLHPPSANTQREKEGGLSCSLLASFSPTVANLWKICDYPVTVGFWPALFAVNFC